MSQTAKETLIQFVKDRPGVHHRQPFERAAFGGKRVCGRAHGAHHNINTVPLNDYNRGASANRYGEPAEVGDTVQELTMTQDKSFSGVIDKGNNMDQSINKAGKFWACR